jgi:hypothetical protein
MGREILLTYCSGLLGVPRRGWAVSCGNTRAGLQHASCVWLHACDLLMLAEGEPAWTLDVQEYRG